MAQLEIPIMERTRLTVFSGYTDEEYSFLENFWRKSLRDKHNFYGFY